MTDAYKRLSGESLVPPTVRLAPRTDRRNQRLSTRKTLRITMSSWAQVAPKKPHRSILCWILLAPRILLLFFLLTEWLWNSFCFYCEWRFAWCLFVYHILRRLLPFQTLTVAQPSSRILDQHRPPTKNCPTWLRWKMRCAQHWALIQKVGGLSGELLWVSLDV